MDYAIEPAQVTVTLGEIVCFETSVLSEKGKNECVKKIMNSSDVSQFRLSFCSLSVNLQYQSTVSICMH